MLRRLILRKLGREEKRMGVSLDYLRHILSVSTRSFFTFARIMPISNHRRELPVEPYFVAWLVAARDEDCGTCVQIEVNLAHEAGVSASILRSVVDDRPDQLRDELRVVYEFTQAVVAADAAADGLREKIRSLYSEKALVEFAMAIAVARFFPVTKRTLGYAKSCSVVQV